MNTQVDGQQAGQSTDATAATGNENAAVENGGGTAVTEPNTSADTGQDESPEVVLTSAEAFEQAKENLNESYVVLGDSIQDVFDKSAEHVDFLQKQLDDSKKPLTEQVAIMETEAKVSAETAATANQQIAALQAQVQQLTTERDAVLDTVAETKSQLAQANAELARLKPTVEAPQTSI